MLTLWLLILGTKVIKCEKNVNEDFCCDRNEQIVSYKINSTCISALKC
jgi:hypothetical protein